MENPNEWFQQERKDRAKEYRHRIERMIQDYTTETSRKEEYQGRQLLELLQNADDAMKSLSTDNGDLREVLISLQGNELVVANKGTPFGIGGLKSLMYAGNSEKKGEVLLIGSKGLGMRSVLNWAKELRIYSRNLAVRFSPEIARRFLEDEVIAGDEKLLDDIKSRGYGPTPIATFAAPDTCTTPCPESYATYDTCLVIRFDDGTRGEILDQFKLLQARILLFLNHIDCVRFEIGNQAYTYSREMRPNTFTPIRIHDSRAKDGSQRWNVHRVPSQNVPVEFLEKGESLERHYEIRIALPEIGEVKPSELFTYFPTRVGFPFPLCAHATLDLSGNRNEILDSDANRYILKRLADALLDWAEQQRRFPADWEALKLMKRQGDYHPTLTSLGFASYFKNELAKRALVPCLDGQYRSIQQAKVYKQPYAKLLSSSKDIFPEMSVWSESAADLIEGQGFIPAKYDPADFVKRLNTISFKKKISFEVRASIIVAVTKAAGADFRGIGLNEMPALFLSGTGKEKKVIPSDVAAMFPPGKLDKNYSLSDIVPLHIINPSLSAKLREISEQSYRQFVQNTKHCFNLLEYEFEPIIRKIVVAFSTLPDAAFGTERKERWVVRELYGVYKNREPSNQFPKEGVTALKIAARDGSMKSIFELYLGKDYGNEMMDRLLPGMPGAFVASPKYFGIKASEEKEFQDFLEWMGVAKRPRFIKVTVKDSQYNKFLHTNPLELQTFEVTFGDNYARDVIPVDRLGTINLIQCGSYQYLDHILEKAGFYTIVSWLSKDTGIGHDVFSGRERHSSAVVRFADNGLSWNSKWREIGREQIPSYVLWQIRTKPWISLGGKRLSPKECCLDSRIEEFPDLFHFFKPDYKDAHWKAEGLYEDKVKLLLRELGFAIRIQDLDIESLYGILLTVAANIAFGKRAKSIYREVYEGLKHQKLPTSEAALEKFPKYREYLSSGKLWSRRIEDGEEVWAFRPIMEQDFKEKIYYQDNSTFSREAIGQLILMDMDTKQGKDDIQRIFKVALVDDLKFDLHGSPVAHPAQGAFSDWLEKFKPYLVFVRRGAGNIDTAKTIQKLNIHLAADLKAEFRIGQENPQIADIHYLEHFEPLSQKNHHYLSLEGNTMDFGELIQKVEFQSAVADVFSNQLGVENVGKDILWLVPYDETHRMLLLEHVYGKNAAQGLRRAMDDLGMADYRELGFWEAYWVARGGKLPQNLIDLEFLKAELILKFAVPVECFDSIDYHNLSSDRNITTFRLIFAPLNWRTNSFNQHFQGQGIDFKIEFRRLFDVLRTKTKLTLKQQYGAHLFKGGDSKSLRRFLTDLETFDHHLPEIDGFDLTFDALTCFKELVGSILGFEFDSVAKYNDVFETTQKARLAEFRASAQEYVESDVNEFLRQKENLSILYFVSATDFLTMFVNTQPKRKVVQPLASPDGPKVSDEAKEEAIDWKKIKEDTLTNLNLKTSGDQMKPSDPPLPSSSPPYRPNPRTSRPPNWQELNKEKEKRGFQAEVIAFEYLKDQGYSNIEWVSGNALLAGELSEDAYKGELGYDMQYVATNQLGKERIKLVEVKSTIGGGGEIHLTRNELEKAMEQPRDYELIYITNLGTPSQKIHHWPTLFVFKAGKSFLNNDHFKVTFEDYVLHFRLRGAADH